jgi:hypothetical protein
MKPVSQTKYSLFYSDGTRLNYGNCLIACIASILDQPIDEVPNVYTFYGLDKTKGDDISNHLWFKVMNLWLNNKFNKQIIFNNLSEPTEQQYVIMRGLSMRMKPHCCIFENKGGVFIPYFDPHPTLQFLHEQQYYYTIENLVD